MVKTCLKASVANNFLVLGGREWTTEVGALEHSPEEIFKPYVKHYHSPRLILMHRLYILQILKGLPWAFWPDGDV